MDTISIESKINNKGQLFSVWTTWDKGNTFVLIYQGPNYERAVEKTNFWDERADTFLRTYQLPMDAKSVAERKFDKAINKLKTAA